MTLVDIRHAGSQDWELLKAVRLQALLDSPDAFCTIYDEAASLGDEVWLKRSSTDPAEDESASFLAVEGEDVVGLAVGVLCDEARLDVVSVFVVPSHRGKGVAQDLMEIVESWGRSRGASVAELTVESGNQRARSFYAGIGYAPTGKRETYPGRVWLHRLEFEKPLGEA